MKHSIWCYIFGHEGYGHYKRSGYNKRNMKTSPNQQSEEIVAKTSEVLDKFTQLPQKDKDTFLNWLTQKLTAQQEAFRDEAREVLDAKIVEAKTRKRMTAFQDTLFNYEVNVLSDIANKLLNKPEGK